MSTSFIIGRYAVAYQTLLDVPEGEPLLPLGSAETVRAAFETVYPGIEWSSATEGSWSEGPDFAAIRLDANPELEGQVTMINVQLPFSSLDEVQGGLVALCRSQSWQVMTPDDDDSEYQFLDQLDVADG